MSTCWEGRVGKRVAGRGLGVFRGCGGGIVYESGEARVDREVDLRPKTPAPTMRMEEGACGRGRSAMEELRNERLSTFQHEICPSEVPRLGLLTGLMTTISRVLW